MLQAMSTYRAVYLTCDECENDGDFQGIYVSEVRAIGLEHHWKLIHGKDICPDCQKIRNERQKADDLP